MFNLFTSTAFEVAPAIQAINDVLFPVVLFGILFMFLCAIFLDNPSVVSDDENIPTECEADSPSEIATETCSFVIPDDYLEQQLASMVAVMEQYQPKAEAKVDLFDVEPEIQKLRAFGARALKAYCKEHKIKGYSTAANAGVEALAKFMLSQQVKAHDVQSFRSKFVA